jgi:flagellar motor switch protein FliM
MLVLAMEATLGDCIEQMQLAFPYFTIEPLVRQLASLMAPEKEQGTPIAGKPRWSAEFAEVPLAVTAQWDNLEISMRSLAQLRTGDVLALDPECFERVILRLAGQPKYQGRLGTQDGKWAVELTTCIKS